MTQAAATCGRFLICCAMRSMQRLFLGGDVGVGQPGQQIVDPRRDQKVGVEDLGGILLGDGDGLGERRDGVLVIAAIGEERGGQPDDQRHDDRADQQQA